MDFIVWLITVVLLYAALGFWIYLLIDTGRRKPIMLPVLILIPFVGILAGNSFGLKQPIELGAICAVILAILGLFWLFVTKPGAQWQDAKNQKESKRQIKLHLALITGSIIFLVPFVWLLTTSFKDDSEVNRFPPVWIPTQQITTLIDGRDRGLSTMSYQGTEATVAEMEDLDFAKVRVRIIEPAKYAGQEIIVPEKDLTQKRVRGLRWVNYSDALNFLPPEYHKGLVPLWNTVLVTLLSIIGTLFSSSLVAYSFARLKWPGRDMLFVILLATMMVPAAVTMLPVFLIFRWIGWVDTLQPLWIGAFFGGAFNIFLLRQFFMTIPTELEDAAKIDGCSLFMIYWRIMLPLIKPALAAVTIFTFMATWNNFMGPLIYISSPEKMTLAYALQLFQGAYGGQRAMMMAASTLVMLPVLIVFFFTQRYFIQGVTLTGIKG